jgi:hypothetical protein
LALAGVGCSSDSSQHCPGGVWVDGKCYQKNCTHRVCPETFVCTESDICVAITCLDVSCEGNEGCAGGICYPKNCLKQKCLGDDELCIEEECVTAACVGVKCPGGERCANGSCLPAACGQKTCGDSEVCLDGNCVEGVCVGVTCPEDLECVHGHCSPHNPCLEEVECAGQNRLCENLAGTATCGECVVGYHEEGSACVLDQICELDSCNGHGACNDSSGRVVCSCLAAYVGEHCENCATGTAEWPAGSGVCLDNPCDPDPCADLSHSVPWSCQQAGEASFSCGCEEQYHWEEEGRCAGDCIDTDEDGYGVGPGCDEQDCNDDRDDVFPGAPESLAVAGTCDDGLDNDCDQQTDLEDLDCQGCASPADCDDNNACTDDDCISSICFHANNLDPCDDYEDCTYDDACSDGNCAGTYIDCTSDDCSERICDGTASCAVLYNTGAPCDDSLFCTGTDSCDGSGNCSVHGGDPCGGVLFCDEGQWSCVAPWADCGFPYRTQLTVSTGASGVSSGYTVSVTIDHAALVSDGKSQADGNDLRVGYWDGASWTELSRAVDPLTPWNSGSTKIWIPLIVPIEASSSDSNYYLYYGYPDPDAPPADWADVFRVGDEFNDGTLTSTLSASTSGTANITETEGEAFIDLGTDEKTDAGLIVTTNPLPENRQFAIRHKTKVISGGGDVGPELKGIGLYQLATQPGVAPSEDENPRRRITMFQRIDGDAWIFYLNPSGDQYLWDASRRRWIWEGPPWGQLSLDTYYIYELISNGTSWYARVSDADGNLLTSTANRPISWASVYDDGDPLWFYWGEVYSDYYYGDQKSDWLYVRDYVSPEPSSWLGAEEENGGQCP